MIYFQVCIPLILKTFSDLEDFKTQCYALMHVQFVVEQLIAAVTVNYLVPFWTAKHVCFITVRDAVPHFLLLWHENRVSSDIKKNLVRLGLLLNKLCRASHTGPCSHHEFYMCCSEALFWKIRACLAGWRPSIEKLKLQKTIWGIRC